MKTKTLPPLRVTPKLRREAESVLAKGETLSAFIFDSVANNRVVFNIKGNEYRLVAAVHYNRSMMFIRFIGTHRDYDKINAATI